MSIQNTTLSSKGKEPLYKDSEPAKEENHSAAANGNSLLLTSKQMEGRGIGTRHDIMTFNGPTTAISLEERFYNLLTGKTNGDFNPEIYTNGGAVKFLNMAHNTEGYQQESGDQAVFSDNKPKISEFLENAKTIVLVGSGSCDKELDLIKLAPNVEEIFIYELSPEFNEHSYWKVKEFTAQHINHHVDVKAYCCDFRNPPVQPEHGPATVICIGGLTNPENVSKENFPTEHYATHLNALKGLANSDPQSDQKASIIMSFTTASREEQMKEIYDTPAFHKWILHPLHRLVKRGHTEGLDPDASKYSGIYYPTSGLFGHHIEMTEDQTIKLNFTDSRTGILRRETVTVFEGDRFNLLTSTGMNTGTSENPDEGKLSRLAKSRAGLRTAAILEAKDPTILQKAQIFTFR